MSYEHQLQVGDGARPKTLSGCGALADISVKMIYSNLFLIFSQNPEADGPGPGRQRYLIFNI